MNLITRLVYVIPMIHIVDVPAAGYAVSTMRKEVIRCLMVQQWGRFSSFGGRAASFIGMTAGGIIPQSTLPSIEAAVRMVSRAGASGR